MPQRNTTHDAAQALCSVPSAVAAYIAVKGDAGGAFRQVTFTLTNLPVTVTNALVYASVKLCDLPAGWVNLLACVAKDFTFTTTSVIDDTLNASKTIQFALGHVAASNATLATTMLTFAPGTGQSVPTFTSSATINVASAAVDTALAAGLILDGSTTAIPMYLNLGIATADDIDADATLTVSGTIHLTFIASGND